MIQERTFGIAIAAPGGFALDQAALEVGIARLRAQGHVVHNYYDPEKKFQRFGGTDAGRLAQLNAAAADPDVQVVMALRGSYGISRILPQIDFDAMAASGKLFVGYSDFTAFHMGLMARTGRTSFAGPMICDDFTRVEPDPFTLRQLADCLRGPRHVVTGVATGNPTVDVEGTLWGGNLAMVAHLVGTAHFPTVSGGILVLEDVGEHPYRIERMLYQLHFAGVLARQRAVLLGSFNGFEDSPNDNGYDLAATIAHARARFGVPIYTGLPFGHCRDKLTLPFGGQAELAVSGGMARLRLSGYGIAPE